MKNQIFYTSDTAILDLMAKHFLSGEFTFYYWGEGYYGILDPLLLVPIFKLLGMSPHSSQLLPLVMTNIFLFFYHRVVARVFRSEWLAHISAFSLALATPYFLQFTFGTYNYICGLTLGMIHLWLYLRWHDQAVLRDLWGIAALAGFCWYYFRMVIIFWCAILLAEMWPHPLLSLLEKLKFRCRNINFSSFWSTIWNPPISNVVFNNLFRIANVFLLINSTVAVLLWLLGDQEILILGIRAKFPFWPTAKLSIEIAIVEAIVLNLDRLRRTVSSVRKKSEVIDTLVVGFIIGYVPALIGNVMGHPPSSPGKILTLPELISNSDVFVNKILPYMLTHSGHGLDIIVPWIFLFVSSGVLISWLKPLKENADRKLFGALFIAGLAITFFGTALADQYQGRYFLPMYIVLPIGVAWLIVNGQRHIKFIAIAGFILWTYSAYLANRVLASEPNAQRPYEELSTQLLKEGIKGGYADYWIAYRLTAIAKESLVFAPVGLNDRYPHYRGTVSSMSRIAVIDYPVTSSTIVLKGVAYMVERKENIGNFRIAILKKGTS